MGRLNLHFALYRSSGTSYVFLLQDSRESGRMVLETVVDELLREVGEKSDHESRVMPDCMIKRKIIIH